MINRKEVAITGAEVYLVNGLISDAGKIVGRAIVEYGWYDASTLKEPYRIEGKKTMGMEIFEQLAWREVFNGKTQTNGKERRDGRRCQCSQQLGIASPCN